MCVQRREVCLSGSGFHFGAASRHSSNKLPSPHLCLIKSSVLNVFAEGKGIFRAENTFADNSWPRYFPKDGCTHSSAHCVCVCWLRSGQIYFQVFFFLSLFSFFSVLQRFYTFFFFFCFLLWATKQKPRSYRQLKYSTHPGSHSWHCTGFFTARRRHPSVSGQERFPWKKKDGILDAEAAVTTSADSYL